MREMSLKFHFISGLPRSGSTVLSALLKQNPRFNAAVTSPVASLVMPLLHAMSGASEFATFFSDERRRAILRGTFESYYSIATGDRVVFDTNRTWTGKIALLHELYPEAKIICCVRDVGWVIDSVERMLRKNPTQLSKMLDFKPGTSIYARVEALMNSERGLIGLAWSNLREAWFSQHADKLVIVNYDTLVQAPEATLRKIYREIGESWYDHDLSNLGYDEPEYDAQLGMPGLHKVQPKVERQNHEPCVPPDIFAKHAHLNFWLDAGAARRGMIIL